MTDQFMIDSSDVTENINIDSGLQPWQSVAIFGKKIRAPGRWNLMAISDVSFYGDESGSHHHESAFVLSGYLAADDVWSEFDSRWHEVLHDTSIGGHAIDYFHMRECFKLEGQFAPPFDRTKADKKLLALVDVLRPLLKSGRIREFTSMIDWGVYDRAIQDHLKDCYHNPYLLLFGATMAETSKYVETKKLNGPIYFFMDDQIRKVEYDVHSQFSFAKAALPNQYSRMFDGVAFRSDEYCYPLQAADLIAWQRHRRELDLPEDRGERREYKLLNNATSEGKMVRYREDGLVRFSKETHATLMAKGLLP